MPFTIGERIKRLRERNHLTLEDVAKYLNIGRPTVFKYETGAVTNIPSDKIEMLARLFNVSPAYLMGWEDNSDSETSDVPQTDEVRLLIRGLNRLSPSQLEQATNVMKAMFAEYAEYFEKENDDGTKL